MNKKTTPIGQMDLFEISLNKLAYSSHPLVKLADEIDWENLCQSIDASSSNNMGAPSKSPRMMIGFFILQQTYGLSDNEGRRMFTENAYWQYFCGFGSLKSEAPFDISSLSRWRKRLGAEGLEKIFQFMIKIAIQVKLIKKKDLSQVVVDTTVMPKNVTYPTDGKLYFRAIQSILRIAKKRCYTLRQTYSRTAVKLLTASAILKRSRKNKEALKKVKKLKTILGRLIREIHRKIEGNKEEEKYWEKLLPVITKIHEQKKQDKNKTYSVHEPEVYCISKGKAHKKFEFGCKASLCISAKKGLLIGAQVHKENVYDGHTLEEVLEKSEKNSKVKIARALVDKGYRGHGIKAKEVLIAGRKKLSRYFKNVLKRRQSIEPIIGHMKSEGRLDRNFLKGSLGDALNVLLCAIGHNVRLLLRHLELARS